MFEALDVTIMAPLALVPKCRDAGNRTGRRDLRGAS
jgi:hypothetical protein